MGVGLSSPKTVLWIGRVQQIAALAVAASLAIGDGLAQASAGVLLVTTFLQAAIPSQREHFRFVAGLPAARWLVGFIVWAVLSATVWGLVPAKGLGRVFDYGVFFSMAVFAKTHGARWVERALLAFILSLTLVSVYGIAQHYFGIAWFTALSGTKETRWQALAPGETERFIASGFFYSRLKLAEVLLAGLPLAVSFALLARRKLWRVCLFVVVFLMSGAFLFTYARAAILAIVIGVFVTLAMRYRGRGLAYVTLLIGALAAIAAAIPSVRARMASLGQGESYRERFFLWARAQEIIADHPWLGIGWNAYGRVCPPYYDRVDPSFPMRTQAHQQFLTVLAELGPIGLLLFVGLCVTLVAVLHSSEANHAWAIQAFVLALGVVGLSHDPLFYPIIVLSLFSLTGLFAGLSRVPFKK